MVKKWQSKFPLNVTAGKLICGFDLVNFAKFFVHDLLLTNSDDYFYYASIESHKTAGERPCLDYLIGYRSFLPRPRVLSAKSYGRCPN